MIEARQFKWHRPFYDDPYIVALQHDLTTGDGPLFLRPMNGSLPMGLSEGTHYFAIVINGDCFRFATSKQNALDGHAVHMTTPGSGFGMYETAGEP